MDRFWRRLATLLAAAVLALPARCTAAAASDSSAAPDSAVVSSSTERHCDALADQLEARAAEVRERSGEENVLLLEALEIADVANELVAEGDVDSAALLFQEALALLEPVEAEP